MLATVYGVLFPLTTEIQPDAAILAFLDDGGKAILFGEQLRPSRIAAESREAWGDCG
ncbi:MAG: hypothetical protein ABIV25_02655 [Paracoccaceae bacterium]